MEQEWEAEPAAGFAIEDTMTEFEITQAEEVAEQTAILESIQQRPRWRSTSASSGSRGWRSTKSSPLVSPMTSRSCRRRPSTPKPDTEVVDISMMSSLG